MTDNHSQSFFGKSTGITIQSSSKTDPYIFLKCIKKKADGKWEKPTQGEGKTIKLSLEEMVMISHVLNKKTESWSSYHSFKNTKTSISFKWKEEDNILWINIGDYSKMLTFSQIEIFRLLLKHIIKEKIEFATTLNSSNFQENKNRGNNLKNKIYLDKEQKSEFSISKNSLNNIKLSDKEKVKINGILKAETEKALLINFNSGHEIWIPKSIVYSENKKEIGLNQAFLIDKWILERNKILV
ncbi:MAG: hypothetical protein ACFFAO_21970 [Candidatus Hermodarchaeota archaeon]